MALILFFLDAHVINASTALVCTKDTLNHPSSQFNYMCENVSKRVIFITNLVVHVHGRPKGQVIRRDSFIHTYSTSGLDGNCIYAQLTMIGETCEMDLVIAQQLVQT